MSTFVSIPERKTFEDYGLDTFGQSPLKFSGNEVNLKAQTMFEAGVPSNFIQAGDFIQRLNVIDGWLQSANFVTGVAGWRIDSDGNVEFQSGTFRGDITAASGTFGNVLLNSSLYPNAIVIIDENGVPIGVFGDLQNT